MITASATVWLPDDVVLAVASFAGRPAFGRLGSTCRALRIALISDSSCTALEFEADLRQKPQICTESFDFPRFGQQLPRLAQLDCCAPPNASWVLLHLPSHLVEMPSIAPRALRAAFASIHKLARLSFWVDAQHFGGTGQGGGGVHTDAGTNTNTGTGTRARTDSTAGLAGRVLRRLHRCCRRRGCNACPRNNPAPPARNVENGPGSWHSGRSASTQDCPRVALQHIVIGLWQRRVKLGAAAARHGRGGRMQYRSRSGFPRSWRQRLPRLQPRRTCCDEKLDDVRPRSLLHHAFGVGGGSPTPIPTPTFGTHNRDAHRAARARGQKSVGVGGEGKLPCPLLL